MWTAEKVAKVVTLAPASQTHVTPYVVTKKTVFKWQEHFWQSMKEVFDEHYREQFTAAGLLPHGELQHLISDAASMQVIRWTEGGFGIACQNYDGDILTDQVQCLLTRVNHERCMF